MLVIMLRTVTFIAPWRWCSSLRRARRRSCPAARGARPARRSAGVDSRVLVAQPLDELHREGGRQARRPRAAGKASGAPGRAADARAARRPARRLLARAARLSTMRSASAPQVLHQHDAQRDRHGPQLADGQRLHALVGARRSAAASRGRSGCRCARRKPRRCRRRADSPANGPVRELGQLAIEPGGRSSRISRICSSTTWKLSTSHSAAGVMPASSRITAAIVPVALQQDPPAVAHVGREETDGDAARLDRPGRDALREFLQALGAQELGADGLLGFSGEGRGGGRRAEVSELHVAFNPPRSASGIKSAIIRRHRPDS